MLEKPEPSDEDQLREDRLYGVKYVCDYPACPAADDILMTNRPIIWVNRETWREERHREREYALNAERERELLEEIRAIDQAGFERVLRRVIANNDDPNLAPSERGDWTRIAITRYFQEKDAAAREARKREGVKKRVFRRISSIFRIFRGKS